MKTVIILTQPRSGSSLLAGILHKLGVSMGDNEEELIAKSHDNKYGSYEDQDFQVLHHRLLFKAKILIRYPNRLKEDESRIKKAVEKYEDRLVALIRKKERKLWGWKDAVLIYTIPYFEKHLKNPYYIFLNRPPESVANSQIQAGRKGRWWKEIKLEYSYQPIHQWIPLALRTFGVILRHGFIFHELEYLSKIVEDAHRKIEHFTKDKKCIQVDLKNLINNSEDEINRIIDFLEISPTEDQIKDAFNFVHPELIKSDVQK
ncbi:MAG: sulfotransferase [Candidatus Heimdallarchaeota archaeon]|nr:sulfotransferase [Candidatus Heimdallarchaeota archaeon]MCK4770379.1 sulfotransferase [Candidatus Heimdallarchaeota archaeon]